MTARAPLAVIAVVLAGCGGGDDPPALKVSAASSLKGALTAYADRFSEARVLFSFAGSDELAAQIRRGARPDVFASADTTLPDALFAAGLVERPAVFAGNELVLAVPAASTAIRSLRDAGQRGRRLAVGDADVPVGRYTVEMLSRLPSAQARAILANVRSREPDVNGIVGKLVQGAVDAGVVYLTDVTAAAGLRAIRLPPRLRPRVAYAAAVVKGGRHAASARAFVDGLLAGTARRVLAAAGFRPPPRLP